MIDWSGYRRWLLNWEIVRCRAGEDPPDVGGCLAERHSEARSIADQTTRRNVFAPLIHRRDRVARSQPYQPVTAAEENRIITDKQRAGLALGQ